MNEVNLENPIFTYYINIGGLSRQRAESLIGDLIKDFQYNNTTIWFVPIDSGNSRIELIWKGSKYMSGDNESLGYIKKKLTQICELMAEGINDVTLKQKLREFAIDDIIDDRDKS